MENLLTAIGRMSIPHLFYAGLMLAAISLMLGIALHIGWLKLEGKIKAFRTSSKLQPVNGFRPDPVETDFKHALKSLAVAFLFVIIATVFVVLAIEKQMRDKEAEKDSIVMVK